jgi:hypothetical protein
MSSSFEQWLNNLPVQEKLAICEQRQVMEDAREKYSGAVFQYYKDYPPFLLGRDSCRENIKQDLSNFYDLVTECLRIGDLQLLFDLAINPIFGSGGNIHRLADPENLAKYEATISVWVQESKTDLERLCMQTLRDYFRDAIQFAEKEARTTQSNG